MESKVDRRVFLTRSSQIITGAAALTAFSKSNATTTNESLCDLSATAAVEGMRKGEFKAEAYAEALLGRAAELSDLNSFRTLNRDAVLAAARGADQLRRSGGAMGRLHGLPIPIKDSVNTKSLPTSNGTRALEKFMSKEDAGILNPLLSEGAIVMGKTNLHELSWGWTSNNATYGPVRNPYDRTRIPGGSSGGSAAAVAARMAPLAVGEDTLGSIRIPASCCGIAGLRPTFGRYPDDGILPITKGKFDQVGSLARSVADLALFDSVVTSDYTPISPKRLAGVRIGLCPDFFQADLDDEVDRITRSAFQKLQSAGAILVEAKTPELLKAASEIDFAIIFYETVPAFTEFLEEQHAGLSFDAMFRQVSASMQDAMKAFALPPNRPATDVYEKMLTKRAQLKEAVRAHFREQNIAALAFPTIMCPPPKIGEDAEVEIKGQKIPLSVALVRNIALGNCASMASLVLPAGFTQGGLPVGLEFDALSGGDRDLLSLGFSIEKALGPSKHIGP